MDFLNTNLPLRSQSPYAIFFKIWHGESQFCALMPNFTLVALKLWAYSPQIAKIAIFG